MRIPALALVMSATLLPVVARADDPPPQGVWTGKGQLGWLASQGNTQSKSANALLDVALVDGPWKHALHLGGLYGENTGIVSAERWDALWQSNYSFTPDLFGFGALRYAHDLFSGFQYQDSATAGLGYQLFNTKDLKLSAQLGVGYRRERVEELVKDDAGAVIQRIPGDTSSGAIASFGLDYSQDLTGTTNLSDKLLVESGSGDTLISNALALAVKMSTRLALSLGYTLTDNTKPPAGLKKLDSTETLNLVFAF